MAKTKKSAPAKKPAAKMLKTAQKPTAKKTTTAKKLTSAAARKPAPRQAAAKKPPARKSPAAARGSVEAYVAKQGTWQQAVIGELREILREGAPGATEQIKWGQPVYDWNGPFAHIKAFSSSVNLGFWRGATLKDPSGLLSGEGNHMKHVKITTPAGMQHAAFVALVREAVRLNDELGDPTKK